MSRNFSPDETLIDNLLLNDTSAFEELHHRYCYSLYSYCLDKLNSPEDAKRIVRDIFIALWENRHQLPVNFSISLHLYTEVRKAVVKCVNEKLLDTAEAAVIEKEVIPGFSLDQLQKARQPVRAAFQKQEPVYETPVAKENYESLWGSKQPFAFKLKLRHAFQSMLNLW